MNWDHIKRNWRAVSAKIQVTWGKLSQDDLDSINGHRERLAAMLKRRYGYETVAAEHKVDEFAERLGP